MDRVHMYKNQHNTDVENGERGLIRYVILRRRVQHKIPLDNFRILDNVIKIIVVDREYMYRNRHNTDVENGKRGSIRYEHAILRSHRFDLRRPVYS